MNTATAATRRAKATKRAKPARPRQEAGIRATTRPATEQRASLPPVRRTVGVRELRQNLSVYLARIKQGESLEVTEHGQVVAVLVPVPPKASRYDILLAQGLITPARRSIRDLPPPRKMPPGTRSITEILLEMRDEERY